MAKRFVDTELWQKEWFQDLTLKQKVLVKYIFENCDCAGVWEHNFRIASFIIGEKVSIEDIKEINTKKEQFIFFEKDKIYIKNFIEFQYGTLSENCKPHKPVIEKLKKYKILDRVLKGFPKGFKTLEEKEQEQYKEKEKENTSFLGSSFLKDEDCRLYGEYNNVHLTESQYGKLVSLCVSDKLLNELINSFSSNIEVGKERPYNADLPNAHYERLKSYHAFRVKNPDKFREAQEQKKTKSRGEIMLENTQKVLAEMEFAKANSVTPPEDFFQKIRTKCRK